MFTTNAKQDVQKQKQKKPLPTFPAFLKSPVVELYKEGLDNVRELLTAQDELFTGYAQNYEQGAVILAELALLTRTDPAEAQRQLLRLAEAMHTNAQTVRTQHSVTMQVLHNIGGRTDGK